MSTQLITIDSAPCVSFPRQEPKVSADVATPSEVGRLGDSDFFKGKSIGEMAREQGVGPVMDISVFAGGIPDDEDVDEMLAEIYRLRES